MRITSHYKRLRIRRLAIAVIATAISLFFMPYFTKYVSNGDNVFTISINGTYVGKTRSVEEANELLLEARKNVSRNSDELTFIDYDMTYTGEELNFSKADDRNVIISNMENILSSSVITENKKAYEVKINSFVVDLRSKEEVLQMLQASINKYDDTGSFVVSLVNDDIRELPVLLPVVNSNEELKEVEAENTLAKMSAGFDLEMDLLYDSIEPDVEIPLEDYELGTISMRFGDKIEVTEVYINENDFSDLEWAIDEVTKEVAQNEVYKVVSGDTLSGIALKVGVPMEDLIAMNDSLDDQNSLIRPDDELVYSVPEPKLAVIREEIIFIAENYDAPIEYEYRDDWYTSDSQVLQQPSAGYREAIATVIFENDKSVDELIVAQNLIWEAVPKVVMKGTKIPPTFIKPINGGRMSSTFGPRKAPKKGASSNHKGIDWSTPIGTPVYASCGGTVTKAGWASGYGYVVYINHPNGIQTRYGHLSKVLCSVGQQVSQGQKIALSGNSGVSTGPHIHFELLVNGTHVNPLKYLN